jgi:hypothetical protein
MTDDERIQSTADELRALAVAGKDVPAMLRHVQQVYGQRDCALLSVICFVRAFGAGIASVKAVGGWNGFGSELSDEEVNAFVLPVVANYVRQISSQQHH